MLINLYLWNKPSVTPSWHQCIRTSVPAHLDAVLGKEVALLVMNDIRCVFLEDVTSECSRIRRCIHYTSSVSNTLPNFRVQH